MPQRKTGLLRRFAPRNDGGTSPSLRATGSRECAPDDRLREAIHASPSLRAQRSKKQGAGLLRRGAPRNDGVTLSVIASAAKQSISLRHKAEDWIASSLRSSQ